MPSQKSKSYSQPAFRDALTDLCSLQVKFSLFTVPNFFIRSSGWRVTSVSSHLVFICTKGVGIGVYGGGGGKPFPAP